MNKLFQEIEKVEHSVQFQILVSFYEIYCEKVRDLLSPQQVNMKVSLVDIDDYDHDYYDYDDDDVITEAILELILLPIIFYCYSQKKM